MTDFNTPGYGFRLRITRLSATGFVEGFDVRAFEVGKVYEVGPRLGELLIVMGYAEPITPRLPRETAADDS